MSKLEKLFLEAIEAKDIQSAAIVGRSLSGKSYTKYLGTRTTPDGHTTPLTSTSILFLASATKLLATIAALQLTDAGHLTLDTDLSAPQYLPELTQHGCFAPTSTGTDADPIVPVSNRPTLRHLLTHSAGASYYWFDTPMGNWRKTHPAPRPAPSVPARMSIPLAYQPGEGWMYGTGLDWAGCLVERLSGLSLEGWLREKVLRPLGVGEPEGVCAFFPVGQGLGARMVDLNPRDGGGVGLDVVGAFSVSDGSGEVCYGGHGGYMTAEAYVEVLFSVLANDERLLKKGTVEEMFRPQLEPKAREGLDRALETQTGIFFKNNLEKEVDYGLGGLYVESEEDSGLGKGSLTWGGGLNSAWFIDRKNGTCGFGAPQFGKEPDALKGHELKGHFRRLMTKTLLEEGGDA